MSPSGKEGGSASSAALPGGRKRYTAPGKVSACGC